MKLRSLVAGVAAAGLLMSPAAAMAGTRASSSVPSVAPTAVKPAATSMGERTSVRVGERDRLAGASTLWLVALGAAVVGTVAVVATDDDDELPDVSPGT